MQRVRLKMAASFCPPVHRGTHGSLLPADSIIYPKKRGVPALAKKPRQNRAFGNRDTQNPRPAFDSCGTLMFTKGTTHYDSPQPTISSDLTHSGHAKDHTWITKPC